MMGKFLHEQGLHIVGTDRCGVPLLINWWCNRMKGRSAPGDRENASTTLSVRKSPLTDGRRLKQGGQRVHGRAA